MNNETIAILCFTGIILYALYLADKNPRMQDFLRDIHRNHMANQDAIEA